MNKKKEKLNCTHFIFLKAVWPIDINTIYIMSFFKDMCNFRIWNYEPINYFKNNTEQIVGNPTFILLIWHCNKYMYYKDVIHMVFFQTFFY